MTTKTLNGAFQILKVIKYFFAFNELVTFKSYGNK